MAEHDPIGKAYYRALIAAGWLSTPIFYITAALSFSQLLLDSNSHPSLYEAAQILFVTLVACQFCISCSTRLLIFPRAEERRREELLGNSFGVSLTHETSTSYYNNDQIEPTKRLAASVMESSFFTFRISKSMLFEVRIRTFAYLLALFVFILVRQTDLNWIGLAAQVVFGEEVLSKYLRLEWLRSRSERVFDELRKISSNFSSRTTSKQQARVLEQFASYETAKAIAQVSLSQRIFHKLNAELSSEWEQIRPVYGH